MSHCDFNLHFWPDLCCWTSLPVLICHLCIFFSEISLYVFCPDSNLIVCYFESSLYVLTPSPLLDIWDANIFSHSVTCSFMFLHSKYFKIWWKSPFSIFPLMDHAFSINSKSSFPTPRSWRFSPIKKKKSYIVLHSTFISVI